MRGNTHRPAFLAALLLLLGSLATALLGTRVRAAPDRSPAQDNVVISEFRSNGPSLGFEGSDDFVEIFNPTNQDIDISGWFLKSITATGVTKTQYLFNNGTSLSAGQHFLITGNHYSGSSLPDKRFISGGIPDGGGVTLIGADNTTTIERVGMSPLAAEGTSLPPLSEALDQSYERKPGGAAGSCSDTNDNAADFGLIQPSDPQNASAVITGNLCAGATETASPTSTETFTPTAVNTFTDTFTVEDTPTSTSTATLTLTETQTESTTRTFTRTRTSSPADTAIPTETPTYTPTKTGSPLPTITRTPTSTRTDTLTRTPSPTRTGTFTRTPSLTRTSTYTPADTLTGTVSLTRTPTRTPSFTRTASLTKTATYTRTITRTRTPTRTITSIPGFVIIHEFLPQPHSDWSEDGAANTGDEFIELINLSNAPVNIKNWKLDNGANSHPFLLPELNLLPRQIKVFFRYETNIPLNDEGGTVRLMKADGRMADIFTYPPVGAADRTWCRLFDGSGSLTFACDPTPGRPNVPFKSASAPHNARFSCLLPDAAPAALVAAECGRMGAEIWNQPIRIDSWMIKQGKWETLVE